MSTAYIALGSNLQDKRANIAAAIAAVATLPSTSALRQAALRTTAPVGGPPNQPDYLNTAIEIQTTLPPQTLMSVLLDIERTLGRDRTHESRHGPRLIDLDLILFDNLILTTDTLTLPHPRMHQRPFVLDPLCDLAPNLRHPILQNTLRELQTSLTHQPVDPLTLKLPNSQTL